MNKGLLYTILGIAGLVLGYFLFFKKKRRKTRKVRRSSRRSRSTRTKIGARASKAVAGRSRGVSRSTGGTLSKKILKEAKLSTAFKNYNSLSAKQKQLYNLAKGRLKRKK
jgi:LPXTG-motif cell wall-anchored protein